MNKPTRITLEDLPLNYESVYLLVCRAVFAEGVCDAFFTSGARSPNPVSSS